MNDFELVWRMCSERTKGMCSTLVIWCRQELRLLLQAFQFYIHQHIVSVALVTFKSVFFISVSLCDYSLGPYFTQASSMWIRLNCSLLLFILLEFYTPWLYVRSFRISYNKLAYSRCSGKTFEYPARVTAIIIDLWNENICENTETLHQLQPARSVKMYWTAFRRRVISLKTSLKIAFIMNLFSSQVTLRLLSSFLLNMTNMPSIEFEVFLNPPFCHWRDVFLMCLTFFIFRFISLTFSSTTRLTNIIFYWKFKRAEHISECV